MIRRPSEHLDASAARRSAPLARLFVAACTAIIAVGGLLTVPPPLPARAVEIPAASPAPAADTAPGDGTWQGAKTAGGSVIPGDDAVMAAGSSIVEGAQFTYGAFDPVPAGGASSPSSEWEFWTTATEAADGLVIPWRYTGLHGFAAVTVGLEFWVRAGETTVTSQSLVDAGPQSCNPCLEPSGGFDYSGTVSLTAAAGMTYGFTLRGSNGDTNATLRGELVLGTNLPTDCADAQGLYGATDDGRYLILPAGGHRFSVHCATMEGVGADYLELHPERIGNGRNSSSYASDPGVAIGTDVVTAFTKVRFDPATLRIDVNDRTFSTSTGSLIHPDESVGNPTVTSMPYATAMACNNGGGNDGTAHVSVWGTPFVIDDAWYPQGTNASSHGGATFSDGNTTAEITANGFCGWRHPHEPALQPLYVFDSHPDRFELQLAYASGPPPPTLGTPVLFASIARSGTSADLYARVEGGANTPLSVQVHSAASCTAGVLNAPVLVASLPVTTDAEGYVAMEGVSGISSGSFVSLTVTSPEVLPASACVRTTGDNDYWPKALTLGSIGTLSTQDVIEVEGRARWYRFPIVPDQRITVTLADLPADYDLAVFRDIAAEFESQLVPEDEDDLHRLTAEFAPSVFSPSVFSPSVFSPSVFSPDAYAPSVFSPSVFSPSVFSPSVFSPSVFSPSVFSPSVFSPSVFSPSVFSPSVFSPSVFSPSVFSPSVFSETELEQAFSSAQTRSLIGVSATPGTGDETVVVNSWNQTGYFYVRVSGRGGAFDPDELFTVNVDRSESSCSGVTDIDISEGRLASGAGTFATVILTDSSRLDLGPELEGALAEFAGRDEVDGVIVDVAADTRVGELWGQAEANTGCPFAVNLVAEEIKTIVDSYRGVSEDGELRYVTIVGDDTVIPFFRYPDQSLLGQESGYVPPVRSDSISEASLRRDYLLSQDAYGAGVSIDIRTNVFPIPDLAVGRLVETPREILGMLEAYVATDGVVVPQTSLVTGYDFLTDAADAVSDELGAGGTTVNELITDADVSPREVAAPGATDVRRGSWTADHLRDQLLDPAMRHDLVFLAGHFSANSALAADYATQVVTTELVASDVDLVNSIIFSAGCHSGYNLVDGEALIPTALPLDWAQAFAQKQAVLIAGTGYQYGDTDFLEYSERLYRDFALELRAGSVGEAISVGEALVRAKQTYLATTPDIRGLHEKALLQATLFGLPMFGVDLPGDRTGTPGESDGIQPEALESGPAQELGLASATISSSTTATVESRSLQVITSEGITGAIEASWLEGPDGVVTNPAEPALPKHVVNVTSTAEGQVLRGVGWRGGTYTDTPEVTPLTGAPTTELRGVHAPFLSPVFYPMKMWSTNYFGELTGTGGTNLIITPAQHKADDEHPGKSIRRQFESLDLELFYSGNISAAALADAPTIVNVRATPDAGDLVFTAQVVGNPRAAIASVWIVWTDGEGTWAPLDLTQDSEDSRLWRGRLEDAPDSIQYVVQAVNGVGLVAFDDNLGRYHVASTGATPAPAATTLTLVSPPTSGSFGTTATVEVSLTAGADPLSGRLVTVSIGGASGLGVTSTDGRAFVQVPLNAVPGIVAVTASFAGTPEFLPSSASASFEVLKATTSLTLEASGPTLIGGSASATATLTGPGGGPLLQRSIAFLVTPPGASSPTVLTAITDFLGQATISLPTDRVGFTSVEARFGSAVALAGGEVLDLTDPTYGPSMDSVELQVTWPFDGFFAPIDNGVRNVAKAGASIPVKFSLDGNRGLSIIAAGYPRAVRIACTTGPEDAVEEAPSAGTSGLQYDPATDRYTYVWKTNKSWKNLCYRFELKLVDGTVHTAEFKFR